MVRFGLVSELGTGENAGYARVWFDDIDIVSDWLALPSFATKSAKHWIPVEINSQVGCIIDDETEQGFIAIVLWSETDTPPEWAGKNTMGVKFSDGAEFYYDTESKMLIVNAPESDLNIVCKSLNISGDVNIVGEANIDGGVTATGGVTAEGDISADGDVKAGLVSLQSHFHTSADGSFTSPPTI